MIDLDFLGRLAKEAGDAILEVYATEFDVEKKEDKSPLTLADTRSHRVIGRGLQSMYPDIPVISEEGKETPYSTRKDWSRFWLVDPLDGTKEFIKKNGEFTVNIALVEKATPVLGVIYLPVPDILYLADTKQGCWRIQGTERKPLRIKGPSEGETVRVVKSRSHPSPGLESVLELLPAHEAIQRGSSLKFCAVAAGEAHFYPRFGPTWEWDTAAGQAVVSAAGGIVVDFNGRPFTYNKPELLNGPFLAAPGLDWLSRMGIIEKTASLHLS